MEMFSEVVRIKMAGVSDSCSSDVIARIYLKQSRVDSVYYCSESVSDPEHRSHTPAQLTQNLGTNQYHCYVDVQGRIACQIDNQ